MSHHRLTFADRLTGQMLPALLTVLALLGCSFTLGCGETRAENQAAEVADDAAAQADYLAEHGLSLSSVTLTEPREIALWVLKIDLHHRGVKLACLAEPDPDGEGPAETQLATPLAMAIEHDTIAAFNANAFSMVDGSRNYLASGAADIHGIAINDGRIRSTTRRTNAAFWLDAEGQPHITGRLEETPTKAQFGVAGFQALILDGQIKTKEGGPLAPRTALGIDQAGRYAYVLTVDGRQPGYAMGMTFHELSLYLAELGCHDALNLDGGGSTSLIVQHPEGGQQLINKPSTKVLGMPVIRPVAVTVGVVAREAQ